MSEEFSGHIVKIEGKSDIPQGFKGKIIVLDAEQSEIAKNLKIHAKGTYALKSR